MIRNIVGPPARGEDFFDREELVRLLWERLETGNILLAAPRRFGKTSVMYRLIDHPEPGWQPVHVDAESIREPVNFIIAVLDALLADRKLRNFLISSWKHTTGWIRQFVDGMEISTPWDVEMKIRLKEHLGKTWQEKGEALLLTIREFDAARKPLIVVDELPVMLNLFADNNITESEIRAFLYWFRKLRIDPKIGLTNCRFLIGGSIGIETCLTRLNAHPSFNDFERLTLGELGTSLAKEFLAALLDFRKIKISQTSRNKLLSLVGAPIPYFIQVFVAELASELVNEPGPVGPARLESIYQYRILGAVCKTYFEHYYTRLQQYSKIEGLAAKAILKEMALSDPDPIPRDRLYVIFRNSAGEHSREQDFNCLIGELENDFYIRCQPDGRYAFISKILCDWWRRYYAF